MLHSAVPETYKVKAIHKTGMILYTSAELNGNAYVVSFPHDDHVIKTMIHQDIEVVHCSKHSITITHNGQTFYSLSCQTVEPTKSYETLMATVYGQRSLGKRL